MQTAPLPINETERVQALHSLELNDQSEERFDRVTRLAAEIFKAPIAFVSFIERDREWFKSRIGLPIVETSRDVSFSAYAILGDDTMVIPDTHHDPRFAGNPLVTGNPFVRSYMGHPLRAPDGEKIGTLCIADHEPRPFTPELAGMLRRLSALVEQELQMGNLIAAQSRLLVTQEALLKTQQRLQEELAAAANYVLSLIPPPLTEPVAIDWRFLPSEELGGDCLGYHFLGENKIAVYLLDICGHGVGAALLSVVLLNLLRSRSLPGVDFSDPAAVLTALNREFPISRHGMFFTIWYGVLDPDARELTFSTAGHPPAVLIGGEGQIGLLSTHGTATGCSKSSAYENTTRPLRTGDSLYLYSDGVYELRREQRVTLSFGDLAVLFQRATHEANPLDEILKELRRRGESERFADDVSLLAIKLP
ncbi:MAG: PP2C family protein-serine/threonine phosphatase [Chthoniobacterales bacterium]